MTGVGTVDVYELGLLGTWTLTVNGSMTHVQTREQRVLALLGLRGPQTRSAAIGALWPDTTEARARSNLRTALAVVGQRVGSIVWADRETVALAPSVRVDVHVLNACLDEIEQTPGELALNGATTLRLLRAPDLLHGWYDDWVLAERERLLHRRVRALQWLAESNLTAGHAAGALGFAEEALALEPLLDSSVILQVRAMLLEGNLGAAMQTYTGFRDRLRRELGINPPSVLTDLIVSARAERSTRRKSE